MIMMLIALSTTMLNTACSSEDDLAANNNEITNKKGFALPVTVNVTRQGDATTRATYTDNGNGTGSLGFSTGDKLFVYSDNGGSAGKYAGVLDWVSDGTFSGTITTQNPYTGTIDALLSGGVPAVAVLLPAGYGDYGYLSTEGNVGAYNVGYARDYTKAFVASTTEKTAKALAVEQFSFENAAYKSGGFALVPNNAILNFTITGLTPSTEVTATLAESGSDVTSGQVTPDGSGNATFAMAIQGACTWIKDLTLTVGGNVFSFTDRSVLLESGKIYNITRSALTYPIALGDATSDYVGSVVTTDGNVYATVAAASAASEIAVAVIAYVGTAGSVDASSASYKGLAIALSDANSGSDCQWAESFANCLSSSQTGDIATALGFKNGITCTSTLTGDGHTHAAATAAASNNGTTAPTGTSGWFMPSMGQWNLIVQGLATKKAGSAVTTDLTASVNDTYKADNLNSVITDAGGTGFQKSSYWASTEQTLVRAWAIYFTDGCATNYAKTVNYYVRSIIAF